MKQILDVLSLYPSCKALSNPPRAVIEWPEGLVGVPVIYPMGSSAEESERIREFVKERLVSEN